MVKGAGPFFKIIFRDIFYTSTIIMVFIYAFL